MCCTHLGANVLHYVESHRSVEAGRSLLLIYENGPCSICRNDAVDELIAIQRFPEWMRDECLHDTYSSTREAAANISGSVKPPK